MDEVQSQTRPAQTQPEFSGYQGQPSRGSASIQGRVPPNSLDAERAVLGGILLENQAMNVVTEVIGAEVFYSEANRMVFEAMLSLFKKGSPIDSITLRDELVARNKLESVGGDEYLLLLTDTIPTVTNIESHAKIVKEKGLIRNLITACHEIAARGYGDYGEVQDFLDSSERSIFNVSKDRLRSPYEHVKDVVYRTFQEIHEAAERGERITGLSTGFDRLDKLTAGMHPGDLIIVAGRPGMGKTAFALNIGVNACGARPDRAVAVFSLEMPKEQLVRRMLCSEARVDGSRMRTGQLSREDWPKLAETAGTISELPLWIDDTPSLSLMELRAKTRRLQSEKGLSLVVIDYLQLMRAGGRTDSREQEISEISRSLKALAKELSIPVIALSQLNRGVESRGVKDKRPQLSDLRESGAIEQDADTILFIYRDEVYNRETTERGVAEVIIGKQRAGPTGTVKCRFFSEYTRFDNLAEEYATDSDDFAGF